jgi:hypothetical protein
MNRFIACFSLLVATIPGGSDVTTTIGNPMLYALALYFALKDISDRNQGLTPLTE